MNASRKTALVTGGSRGIGLGIATALAAEGYHLAINGVREEEAVADALNHLRSLSVDVVYCRGNIGNSDERRTVVQQAHKALGRIDVLVNNAGISSPGRRDILEATEEAFDTVVAVNLKGPYFLTQQVAKLMIEQRRSDPNFRGCIVNISSISAVVASTNRGDYCLTKAALGMATKLWATRLAEFGIDVYEVRPGLIFSDMSAPAREKYDRMIAEGALLESRWGLPEDVGRAVATLVRGDVPYATGQCLTLDGGLTLLRL